MHEITERAAELQRQIERGRFAGDDPVIALTPQLAQAEVVARALAAERAGAVLTIGAVRYHPGEDLAEAALRDALDALRSWSFAAARARLDEAAARIQDPALQQRVSLLKALTRHLSALVYVPLTEKLRLDLGDLDEVLRGLDLLGDDERLHYRDELDRLLSLREAAAKGDAFLDAAWTLLRARLASNAGQDEAALLWLLRVAARHLSPASSAPSSPGTDDANDRYLRDLVARARAQVLAMIDPPAPAAATEKPPDAVRPRELLNALTARLGADLGRDVEGGIGRFALAEYVAMELTVTAGRGKGRGRMGKGE